MSQLIRIPLLFLLILTTGCAIKPGMLLARKGDEIMVAGQLFHTGTPVVLWTDPGGYDAYRVERRFSPYDKSSWAATTQEVKGMTTPNRYNLRESVLTTQQVEKVRGGGWELDLLRDKVDQFVLHYDVAGLSRECFRTLQDNRDLSIHFMLDVDGTIYQTLDLKERAWHATTSNSRSIGIEIANIGAYPLDKAKPLTDWYQIDPSERTFIGIPERFGDGGIRTKKFVARPARNFPVRGLVQGEDLIQYDFTPQQYDALIKLTATLCTVFPKITCDYPRDGKGELIPRQITDDYLATYQGIIGHYHIQSNKTDPGPAMDWDKVINGARRLMHLQPLRKPATTRPSTSR